MNRSSPKQRRKLLVAKVGIATITYTVLASPIACNLPNPPSPDPVDARAADSPTGAAPTNTTSSSSSGGDSSPKD